MLNKCTFRSSSSVCCVSRHLGNQETRWQLFSRQRTRITLKTTWNNQRKSSIIELYERLGSALLKRCNFSAVKEPEKVQLHVQGEFNFLLNEIENPEQELASRPCGSREKYDRQKQMLFSLSLSTLLYMFTKLHIKGAGCKYIQRFIYVLSRTQTPTLGKQVSSCCSIFLRSGESQLLWSFLRYDVKAYVLEDIRTPR